MNARGPKLPSDQSLTQHEGLPIETQNRLRQIISPETLLITIMQLAPRRGELLKLRTEDLQAKTVQDRRQNPGRGIPTRRPR